MHTIQHTYQYLLADIGRLSGIPSITRASGNDLFEWCLNGAPKLEKAILQSLELSLEFPLDLFPDWLRPLGERFHRKMEPADLRWIRQILLFCYKAEHAFTQAQVSSQTVLWTDANRSCISSNSISGFTFDLLQRAKAHCTSVLSRAHFEDILPHHGPGAVYDSETTKGKWQKWFSTIDAIYAYHRFFYLQGSDHWLDQCDGLEIDDIIRCRMIPVPKDARGPRLICVHPAESVWIQQGVRDQCEHAIQRDRGSGTWPRGHVLFDDQSVNASLAFKASYDRSMATIDLEQASDRLSDWLVQFVFGRYYKYFGCCRAMEVILPCGSVEPIACYAPMGNATTFPVQSLVFWSLCVATLELIGGATPADVYVFGDDIIVPSSHCEAICDVLTTVGLVVNSGKTFYRSDFRESCGCDAFRGADVTPVRWKTTYDIVSLHGLQSACDTAMRLRRSGYTEASAELYSTCNQFLHDRTGHTLKRVFDPHHGGIAEWTPRLDSACCDAYWHRSTQQFVSPVLRLSHVHSEHEHGWYHALASLTSLERVGRGCDPARVPSRHSRLNRGWTPLLI